MTAGVVGGLSTVAVCAPSDKFLNMGAPLGIGFGVVLASCIGELKAKIKLKLHTVFKVFSSFF